MGETETTVHHENSHPHIMIIRCLARRPSAVQCLVQVRPPSEEEPSAVATGGLTLFLEMQSHAFDVLHAQQALRTVAHEPCGAADKWHPRAAHSKGVRYCIHAVPPAHH